MPSFLFLDSAGKEVARLVDQQPQVVGIQSLEVLAGLMDDDFKPFSDAAAQGS